MRAILFLILLIFSSCGTVRRPDGYKARMIRLKGEINDENDYSDAYYGLTFYGWELVDENIDDKNANYLIRVGLCKVIRAIEA